MQPPRSPPYRSRWIRHPDGERLVLLLGPDGLPVALVCIFLVARYRNTGRTPNTQQSVVGALTILYEWAFANDIDLHRRFLEGRFLDVRETDGLIRAASVAKRQPASVPNIVQLPRGPGAPKQARAAPVKHVAHVALETVAIRLGYIASYLRWLAIHQLTEAGSASGAVEKGRIDDMRWAIQARTPKSGLGTRQQAREGLSASEQSDLLSLMEPGAEGNPFSELVQRRNFVVMRLLELGLRMGELLSLKVSDLDFQRNELVVPRRHDDPEDPRLRQPVAKTFDRRLPISDDLSSLVWKYVSEDRKSCKAARKHPFLIVTMQPGPNCGKPISSSGINKIFREIVSEHPRYSGRLSAHVMRYSANDRFSELMDDQGVSPEREKRVRAYQFGWSDDSRMPDLYSRRHIKNKAMEVSLEIQEKLVINRKKRKEGDG